AEGRAVALLTMQLDDPSGYGRIVRDTSGGIIGIVEQKDASPAQLEIREVNTGLLCCPARHLNHWLNALDNDNAQGEYYLTDIISQAAGDKVPVVAVHSSDIWEVSGVNDKRQLAELERVYQGRIADQLMRDGLMLKDPARFDCRGSLEFGLDTVIDVNVVIEGKVKLADGVRIGPNCVLRDCEIGADTTVLENSVIERSRIGKHCNIGPFARLRPDTELGDKAKIGNFVEIKKAVIGQGSKVNHLSYVGDAKIGDDVNIGAGVITCNYDGAHKHLTEIGDRVFVGSDVQLVAPVKVAADATIGAGSTITKDVEAGNLAVSRSRQTQVPDWQRPKKASKKD
ncbi:MAG: bifunctional UDP-N-acetylglucosamine diphosphorylase/glucosamine-1-phosphate N-acetyltransferase GlmU, partial [Salinisphaeraceae bacterium]|nr:bifunctional UDP-N-acetylglucosamine diphosphorylase/glucosamine-1-phosphate N-acetyltransferase GlmU [Salinisphaeraceae bacterium]